MDNDPVQRELLSITGGDEAIATVLRRTLTRLAKGEGGPLLKELARDVLTGKVELRTALLSETYGAPMSAAFGKFRTWYDEASEKERGEAIADARRRAARLHARARRHAN